MGFSLITTTGTWDPASYGLKAGDVIHIKCVGGGGGGEGAINNSSFYAGADGGTTSFGNILSAEGGYGTNNSSSMKGYKDYSCPGTISYQRTAMSAFYSSNIYIGATGGNGWLPNGNTGGNALPAFYYFPAHIYTTSSSFGVFSNLSNNKSDTSLSGNGYQINNRDFGWSVNGGANYTVLRASKKYAMGSAGGVYAPSSAQALSAGGCGFGAGGGSSCYPSLSASLCSGSGGVVKDIEYILPNTNAIAVTIGLGGAGGGNSDNSSQNFGGAGADGCVAIWW